MGSGNIYRILIVCVIAVSALMSVIKIGDYDIWFHLKYGEHILKTGSIATLDPFSYATPGLYLPVHSWLAAVVYYLINAAAGPGGLIIFNSLLFAAAFIFIYLTMRLNSENDGELFTAAVVLILTAFALRFRMWVRPHVFEFVFLASTVYLLNLYRTTGKNRLFVIPVIQALWVNTHGSQILGLIIPAIFIAGEAIRLAVKKTASPAPPKRFLVNVSIVLSANIIATAINPDAYEALVSPFTILSPFMQSINEFQPLELHHLWGYELRYTWAFAAVTILGLAGFIIRAKKPDFTDMLLFAAFLLMAIKGIRFIAEFAVIASPIVFKNLSKPVYRMVRGWQTPAAVLLLLVLFLGAVPLAFSSPTYRFGLGVKENIFPEKALRFIEGAGIKGNIFNSYAFGDYIMWRSPERKVFMHGHSRSETFPQEIYKAYLDSHTSPEAWQRLVDNYGITYTLLEYYATDYGGKEVMAHLAQNPQWTPVYWDGLSIVYVKDGPENAEVVGRLGFKFLRPTYLDFSYLDRYIRHGMTGPVLEELGRLIAISPDNEEAYLARAYISFNLGKDNYANAADDLKRAILINPAQAMSHSALGILYMKMNDIDGAEKEFRATLKLDPGDPSALNGLKAVQGRR